MKEYDKPQAYYLEWIDSTSRHGWSRLEELDEHRRDAETSIKQVGFFLEASKQHETYCFAMTAEGQIGGMFSIPRVNIKKKRKLALPE